MKKKKRYLFISFMYGGVGEFGYGNMYFECIEYPSNNQMVKYGEKQTGETGIVIMNIFEFHSKEDFENFRG